MKPEYVFTEDILDQLSGTTAEEFLRLPRREPSRRGMRRIWKNTVLVWQAPDEQEAAARGRPLRRGPKALGAIAGGLHRLADLMDRWAWHWQFPTTGARQ